MAGRWQLAGEDQWTAYEFAWLNARGKPEVAELSFNVPVTSPNIIESKSMKLHQRLSQTRFANAQELLENLGEGFSGSFGCTITANLRGVNTIAEKQAAARPVLTIWILILMPTITVRNYCYAKTELQRRSIGCTAMDFEVCAQ